MIAFSMLFAVWLQWDYITANVQPPIQGYRVYYGPPGQQTQVVVSTSNRVEVPDTLLPAGAPTHFTCRAFNTEGTSQPSNMVAYTKPAAPTPTPSPSATPTPSPSPTPTATPTPGPSPTATPSPTPPTPSPTPTPALKISDIQGLQEALDSKAEKNHQHSVPSTKTQDSKGHSHVMPANITAP